MLGFCFRSMSAALAKLLELLLKLGNLFITAMFKIDKLVARALVAAHQFVELQVNCPCVAVLGVLDQEHHQERHDRRAGIDDQLPCVGVMVMRPEQRPDDYRGASDKECDRRADGAGGAVGESTESLAAFAR